MQPTVGSSKRIRTKKNVDRGEEPVSTLRFCYCVESLGIFVNASALDSKFFFGVSPESNSHYGIAAAASKRDKKARKM